MQGPSRGSRVGGTDATAARARSWRGSRKIRQYGGTVALGGFMARLHSFLTLACVTALPIALPLALGGCVGALVVGGLGAAAGGGYAAGQERGVNGSVDDFAVKSDVERGLMKAELLTQGSITATVYGGRVLLTGHVPGQQIKAAAEQVAGRTHDVR